MVLYHPDRPVIGGSDGTFCANNRCLVISETVALVTFSHRVYRSSSPSRAASFGPYAYVSSEKYWPDLATALLL